jgi:hypothetical protein
MVEYVVGIAWSALRGRHCAVVNDRAQQQSRVNAAGWASRLKTASLMRLPVYGLLEERHAILAFVLSLCVGDEESVADHHRE